MTRRVSSKEARDNFADLLGSVYYTKEPVIVERKGKPYAVMISPDQYERYRRQEERDWQLIEQVQSRNVEADPEEVMADVTAEVNAARQERYAGERSA